MRNLVFRSSRPELFLRKSVVKICSKFTWKHPCRSGISIKLQSNFIEIALRHGCSAVNLLHISRTPSPKNTSGGLLLKEYSAKIRGFIYSRPKFVKKLEQTDGGHPTGNYLLKANNRNTRKKVRNILQANKNTKQSQWRRSGVFIVNFEYMSQLFLVLLTSMDISLVSLLSTLNSYLRTATKKHSELCQTSEMELFTKIANGLSIIAISSILDVWQSYEHVLVLLWILLWSPAKAWFCLHM